MSVKKKWKDLSPLGKCALMLAGAVQIALQAAALRDLSKRAPLEVNGPKMAWVAASFINFAGPIAYFMKGRRK